MADLMKGKRGLLMGVANERSIAWGIAKALADEGAELAFSYQGDAFGKRVEPLAASVGSSSTSIEQSSQSSTRDNRVAEGRYRIEAVAAVTGEPETVRLNLQPLDGGAAFSLLIPQATYDGARLGVGDAVRAAPRPYGTEFARADPGQAFFLVLDDAASRDLRTRPVAG